MVLLNRGIAGFGHSVLSGFSRRLAGSCSVLLYHRVCRLDNDYLLLSVTPDNFYEQINFLKRDCRILTAEEFREIIIKRKRFPPRSVLLTFDDGYADNYYNAMPVLEALDVQAIFFISTGFVDKQVEFWWDKLENIIIQNGQRIKEINFNGFYVKMESLKDGVDAFNKIFPVLRNLNVADRGKLINEWAAKASLNLDRDAYRPMTWEELKQFKDSSSVVIGGHTVNHPSLGALSIPEQRFEIESSKKELERHLNTRIYYFSYPFGQAYDYTKNSKEICKDAGYEIAFANYPDRVTIISNRYSLPRFVIRDWNLSEFEKQSAFFCK